MDYKESLTLIEDRKVVNTDGKLFKFLFDVFVSNHHLCQVMCENFRANCSIPLREAVMDWNPYLTIARESVLFEHRRDKNSKVGLLCSAVRDGCG